MAQTHEGALKAAITMKAKYGDNYYATQGKLGGTKSRGGGFGEGEIGRARAVQAGKKGGLGRTGYRKAKV